MTTTDIIEVTFPGGKRVDAKVGAFLVHTDQSVLAGGEGSAPEPFSLFLASIATCAGVFALGFCQARDIDTHGLSLHLSGSVDTVHKLYKKIHLQLTVPPGFPEKYHESLIKAVDLCTVKRHLSHPPTFDVSIANP